jgi:hypothetical protein
MHLAMPAGALQGGAAQLSPSQKQQQQHVGWLDSLHVPQLLRKRAPSKDQQPPAAVDPANSFDAAASAAAEPGSSSSRVSASSSSGRWKARRVHLLQLLDSPGTSWLLMVMTLFVIFQEDVKYAVLPPGADLGLEAVTLALLLLFMLEIGAVPCSSRRGDAAESPPCTLACWCC